MAANYHGNQLISVIKLGTLSTSFRKASPLLLLKHWTHSVRSICNTANRTESKEVERAQRKATIWIMGNWDKSYKQRLIELRLLPLSYYFELHDLLVLLSMLKGSYNIKLPIKSNTKPNDDLLLTRQKDLTSTRKTRTRKADENFFGKEPANYWI